MRQLLTFFVSCCFLSLSANAQDLFKGYEHLFTQPLSYKIYRTIAPVKMDGLLNEASWNAAAWSTDFVDIEGDRKPLPPQRTRFKMLWDNNNLYIAAELEETHIWNYFIKRDTIVYNENDFEIFIDPDGDAHNYFEIEVNALKNVFDLFMNKPYSNGGQALISWDVKDLKVGVKISGTINNPGDTDKKWVVEMAVPFSAVSFGDNVQVPVNNTLWRLNFSRVEWDTDIAEKKYKKKKDTVAGKNLPEHNWVWSPQGIINMHRPERWGYAQFTTDKPAENSAAIVLPASEEVKKILWLVYYKEHNYFKEKRKFSALLSELNFNDAAFKIGERSYTLEIAATPGLFEAILKNNAGDTWRINQDGEIRKQ